MDEEVKSYPNPRKRRLAQIAGFGGPKDGRAVTRGPGAPQGSLPTGGGPGYKKQHPILNTSAAKPRTAWSNGKGPVANSQNLVAKINFLRQRRDALQANPVTQKSGAIQTGTKQADKIAFLRQQLLERRRKRAAGPQSGVSRYSK